MHHDLHAVLNKMKRQPVRSDTTVLMMSGPDDGFVLHVSYPRCDLPNMRVRRFPVGRSLRLVGYNGSPFSIDRARHPTAVQYSDHIAKRRSHSPEKYSILRRNSTGGLFSLPLPSPPFLQCLMSTKRNQRSKTACP